MYTLEFGNTIERPMGCYIIRRNGETIFTLEPRDRNMAREILHNLNRNV